MTFRVLSACARSGRTARRVTLTEPNDVHEFSILPGEASAQAAQVDGIYFFMLAVTAFFSLLIASLLVSLRHQVSPPARGRGRRRDPRLARARAAVDDHPVLHHDGDVRLGREGLLRHVPAARGAMEIYVVGKQWMWKAQHMDGQREINELHVPVGRPVKLTMGSEDVIHSFYIPAFRVKADVIPGRYNVLWFTATKPGRYHLFCAEYCGTKHSGMIGWVYVDGAERLPGLARRAARPADRRRPRARSCSPIWSASPATGTTRRRARRS